MVKLIYSGVMNGRFILKGGLWSDNVVRGNVYDVPDVLLDMFLSSGYWKKVEELPKIKLKPEPVVEVKKVKRKAENIRLRCKC